jgi:hypothetical protein
MRETFTNDLKKVFQTFLEKISKKHCKILVLRFYDV